MIDEQLQAAVGVARSIIPNGVVALWALTGVVVAAVLMRGWRGRYVDLKVGASLLVLCGLVGALLWLSVNRPERERRSYKFVDEIAADLQKYRGRHLTVHGLVVPGSIERRLGTDRYRFRLESRPDRPPAVIEVRYAGLVPDTFRSGAEIIALGTLAGDGGLEVIRDGIMTRCPSTYAPSPKLD